MSGNKDAQCPPGLDPSVCEFARRADDEWRQWATSHITQLDTKVDTLVKNTGDIIDFFNAGKGFFVIVRWVGTLAKYLTYIGAVLGALWAFVKFGAWVPPKL